MPRLVAWAAMLVKDLSAASGRGDDKAVRWIIKVEKHNVTLGGLAESGSRFQTLDRKLAAVLATIVPVGLG